MKCGIFQRNVAQPTQEVRTGHVSRAGESAGAEDSSKRTQGLGGLRYYTGVDDIS